MAQKALLDTNVFLHVLFEQDHRSACLQLFSVLQEQKAIGFATNFSLFSITLLAYRKRIPSAWLKKFLLILQSIPSLSVLDVGIDDLSLSYQASEQIAGLDLEDAIQYFMAKKCGVPILTYDSDFKRTDLVSMTPEEFFDLLR